MPASTIAELIRVGYTVCRTDLAIAWRNLGRHGRRSGLVLAALMFGVAASILANSFVEWILWATRETTIHSQLGHIQITRRGYSASGFADYAYLIPEDAEEREVLKHAPHVVAVAPRIAFSGLVSRGDTSLSFLGEAVDPQQESVLYHVEGLSRAGVTIVRGEDLSSREPYGVVLGEGLAANIGAQVGDTLTLLANTKSGGVNAIEVRVRGIFATISKAFDDSALRTSRTAAQALLRISGDHRLVVLLDETARTDEVLAYLRARLAGLPLDVTPWYELSDFYNKTVALFTRQTQVVRLFIAVIIILSISNTMMMNISERIREIGTSMALGMRRRRILVQFLIEGALIGGTGGVLGCVVGVLAAGLISTVGIPMPPPPGQSWGYSAEMLVTPAIVSSSFALALIVAVIASVYPAWKASRLHIVNALRYNG